MAFKIGEVYRITNRYLEIIHNKDIFSKPVSSGNGLHIVGMLNSYISIPLYNSQNAIGIIFEQLEPSKERDILFNPKNESIISKIRLIGTFNPLSRSFKRGIDYFPTLESDVFTIEENDIEAIYNSTLKSDQASLQIGNDIYFNQVKINADPNILFGKHCAIFGNTGSGKSCTVTSILQGVYLEKDRLQNANNKSLKTIIIDSNEEYSNIFDIDGVKPDWVTLKDYSDLELSHKDLSFYELTQLLKEDSPNVIPYLKTAVKKLKDTENVDENIYFEFSQLEIEIENAVPEIENRGRMVPDTFTIGFLKHIIMRIKHFSSDERFKAVFNKNSNTRGQKIKVIIGSPSVAEGHSFKNCRNVHIMEPYWNQSKLDQIIGRAVRYCSHKLLDEDKRNVKVYIYIAIHEKIKESIDEYIRKLANKKDQLIKEFEYALKEIAIDCKLFKNANQFKNENSIVCDL
jgi:ABC-type dipeptide/oligopeptide/nickel transport system ATPase component